MQRKLNDNGSNEDYFYQAYLSINLYNRPFYGRGCTTLKKKENVIPGKSEEEANIDSMTL